MTKIAKKPKKRKSQYSRPSAEDRLYGETDIMYGEIASNHVNAHDPDAHRRNK